jgi:hypothetical protein
MRVGLQGRAMAQAVSRALATRKPGFDRRSVRVRIMVGKVALAQVFLPVLRFSAVSITFICVHVAVTEGQTEEAWLQTTQCSDGYRGAMDREAVSRCLPPRR